MLIIINGKEVVESSDYSKTVADIVSRFKPEADMYVVNGGVVDLSFPIKDGDEVVLINKEKLPEPDELESMLIARHSPQVHNKIKGATVGIAGLGGIGSHVAVSLVRMGVGKIVGVDFDIVEPTNINRQHYYLDQLGMRKSEALKETLQRISPLTELVMLDIKVDESNTKDIFIGCDVLVEAFDDFNEKVMLFESWKKYLDCFYVGSSGVAGINDGNLTVKNIGDRIYIAGDFESESAPGKGLMATKVGIVANMQANVVIKILLDEI